MAEELEKNIDQDMMEQVGKAVEEMASRPIPLKPVTGRPQTLSEQWARGQQIMEELKRRVQSERLAIQADFDRQMVETNADYDKRIDDAIASLEKARRQAVQELVDRTQDRLREHELLAQKMH